MPKRGTAHAGARHCTWGSEPASKRSSRQQSLCLGSAGSAERASSCHPQEHPEPSVQLYPTSAGRQGDAQPRTAPPALPFPAALGIGCFQPGFSRQWAAFTDAGLLPEQHRLGGGRGYLGCPDGKRQRCEPSLGQVPTVQRAGLGLPGTAEARACSSLTSASPARGCGPE